MIKIFGRFWARVGVLWVTLWIIALALIAPLSTEIATAVAIAALVLGVCWAIGLWIDE